MTNGAAHRICFTGGNGEGGDLLVEVGGRWVYVGTLSEWDIERDMIGSGNTFTGSGRFSHYWVSAKADRARVRPLVPDQPKPFDFVGTLCALTADEVTIIDVKPWEGAYS